MKIQAKNFTGQLPNGNRYKIVVTTAHGFVNAYLYEEKNGTFWVESVAQSLFKKGYRSYLEALRNVLNAMQRSYNLCLFKDRTNLNTQ
ncbi:hypothetical protein NBRC110019_20380 [Neptunitalea chrysea]|uniref:Uncharacterized protein n=1 Tax=Neptunitalea chrysea TaxID=1647581 RepID=A0A9W6B5G7_9FLAO|nr:hypothetical protein [Neptunitalea chrysea]GLB52998.1 hypothetical protein NBRC110019_20380 [Neptunitalea chrysea]